MQGEPPTKASTPTGAVFLSYASQDQEAAQRICEALRTAGIEAWLDQSELRGGDAWERQIRERIHDCRLFIPLISAQTEARDEGYFRREWKLAVDRTHDMLEKKAFLLPVAIDATPERGAAVPDKFHEVQWTRLPSGEASPEFVARIKHLLSPEPPTTARTPADAASGSSPIYRTTTNRPPQLRGALLVAVVVLALAVLAYLIINKTWISKPAASPSESSVTPSPASPPTFTPPPHSIAVLPFVNMSGDLNQEYFSEGLTEELLNSLSRINELQVAARTSSFYFKGERTELSTIAHKLNVASILEGSVRRSGHRIRITAQLNNAITGFHLWSETYDRDLGDVLKLQSEIADAVASALKVTLLGDTAAKIMLGGTHNPDAFDTYLRAEKLRNTRSAQNLQAAIAAYSEAIRLDPAYALALAGRSLAFTGYASEYATEPAAIRANLNKGQVDARRAIELAPDLAEGHLALARAISSGSLEFARATEEYDRALALAPGNARMLSEHGRFTAYMGHADAGIASARRALVLDPLNPRIHFLLGQTLHFAHRYDEAAGAQRGAMSLDPDYSAASGFLGLSEYAQGNYEAARVECETKPDFWVNLWCLAVTYDKLGRHADAAGALKKYEAANGDSSAYQYAAIHAQWGDTARALEWLETALRMHDSGLVFLKTDPLMDPLRKEPRFQAIERALKFPN